ncbi:unnamed protein product [Thlaspi arvense]|uniref:Uncharacterized protein n=1 Tax=Thlaspi arvense TaxID=13288 RepID=A0AAU9T579_THLAR|nr:unnamed protein product [Thlaspi arvense]
MGIVKSRLGFIIALVHHTRFSAMDTTETGDAKLASSRSRNLLARGIPMKKTRRIARKMKAEAKAVALDEEKNSVKGKPMKRTKNVRKKKAVAKAIALSEKYEKKATKDEDKTFRTISAKQLGMYKTLSQLSSPGD